MSLIAQIAQLKCPKLLYIVQMTQTTSSVSELRIINTSDVKFKNDNDKQVCDLQGFIAKVFTQKKIL